MSLENRIAMKKQDPEGCVSSEEDKQSKDSFESLIEI